MSKGIRQRPPVNFSLFRQVLYAHIVAFLMMLMLGMVFTVLSLVLFYTYGTNWLLSLFICPLFLLSGLFITGFAFKSTRVQHTLLLRQGAVETVWTQS